MLVDTLTIRLNDVVYHEPNLTTQAPSVDVRTGEVAGMIKVIEIWSKERFETEMKKSGDNLDGFSDYMADLGI